MITMHIPVLQEKHYPCELRIKTALLLDDLSFKTALRDKIHSIFNHEWEGARWASKSTKG